MIPMIITVTTMSISVSPDRLDLAMSDFDWMLRIKLIRGRPPADTNGVPRLQTVNHEKTSFEKSTSPPDACRWIAAVASGFPERHNPAVVFPGCPGSLDCLT